MRPPGRHRYAQVGIVAGCLTACGLGIVSAVQADIGPGDPPGTFAYLRSDDAGNRFVPQQLDDVHEDVTITHVKASAGAVHALFDTNTDDPLRKVLYRRSTDGGRSFARSVRLDVLDAAGRPSEGDSSESQLDATGDAVHVVWEDDPVDGSGHPDPCCDEPDRDDVMYARSTDEGRTFAVPVNVTSSPDVDNRDPNVAADGDLVAIVYEARNDVTEDPAHLEDDVRLVLSTDGGATFGAETNLTNAAGEQDEPGVDVAGRTVHVVFRNSATLRAGYLRSTDGGASFSAPVDLPGTHVDTSPSVLAQGALVHVVVCRDTDEDDGKERHDLLYLRSTDAGATFARPVVLFRGKEACNKPALDAVGNDLHIVWENDVLDSEEVFHLHSRDGGRSFGPARNLSDDDESSTDPSVAVRPGRPASVYVAWKDKTDFLFAADRQRLPMATGGKRTVADEDVVRFTGAAYELVLDGSDVGLGRARIDALASLAPVAPATLPSFVLSFEEPIALRGMKLDDSDLVRFIPSRLGAGTAGRFRRYFDGSDIGLDKTGEDVDAVEIDGNALYLSTTGDFSLRGRLSGRDEDVFACTRFRSGTASACGRTGLPFDGSRTGLNAAGEDVKAFAFTGLGNVAEGAAFFAFGGRFHVPTASGGSSDTAKCAFPEEEGDDEEKGEGGEALRRL